MLLGVGCVIFCAHFCTPWFEVKSLSNIRHQHKYEKTEHISNTKRILYIVNFLFFFQHVNFNWTVGTASAIDSSIFWGYLVTQVPGGFLAAKYPANLIFGTAIACSSFINLFVPFAMQHNSVVLICMKILQGLVEVRIKCETLKNL